MKPLYTIHIFTLSNKGFLRLQPDNSNTHKKPKATTYKVNTQKMTNSDHTPTKFDEIENPEIPKWQLNHLKTQLMAEVEEEIEGEEFGEFNEPDSKIQGLVKEVYETLKTADNGDAFDKFYENSELSEYNRMDLFREFVEELLEAFNLRNSFDFTEEELESEEVEKALKKIAENISEGDNTTDKVKDIIKDQYPELINDHEYMDKQEYLDKQENWIEKNLSQIAQGLEPKEDFEDYFKNFRDLNNNQIDDVAQRLDGIVDIGVDVWKLIIYSMLSAPAPKFKIDDRWVRSSLHLLLIGEISTAKSKILGIINDISPKAEQVSDMTKASFIGAYSNKDDEIKPGVVDRIIGGNMLVEEYDKLDLDDGLMREVFDNGSISVSKAESVKRIDEVNTSIMAGANPKEDFFIQGENMRNQIPFKEGELSRFDVTIPLVNTQDDMERIIDDMNLFGGSEGIEMEEIKNMMKALKDKLQTIEEINFEETEGNKPSLETQIKEAFKSEQKTLETKNRQELLISRDFETLVRLVYIIGAVHEDLEDKTVTITEDTVNKAISQFETLIGLRHRLYTGDDRQVVTKTPKDEIMEKIYELSTDGEVVPQTTLKDKCMSAGVVNNKQTFYNKVDELIREEKIAYKNPDKKRYKEIQLLAQ